MRIAMLAVLLFATGSFAADPTFSEVKTLTEGQQKVFDSIKSRPTTVSIVAYKYEGDTKLPISIPLVDKTFFVLVINKGDIEQKDDHVVLTWKDSLTENGVLSIRGNTITGLIYHDNKVYAIQPLGDGVNAHVQIDQTKFPKEKK